MLDADQGNSGNYIRLKFPGAEQVCARGENGETLCGSGPLMYCVGKLFSRRECVTRVISQSESIRYYREPARSNNVWLKTINRYVQSQQKQKRQSVYPEMNPRNPRTIRYKLLRSSEIHFAEMHFENNTIDTRDFQSNRPYRQNR